MVRGTIVAAARHRQDDARRGVREGRRRSRRRARPGADFVGARRPRQEDQDEAGSTSTRVIATPDMMGVGRPARQGARPARPDAEPEARHRDDGRRRTRCASTRPARSSTASTRPASSTLVDRRSSRSTRQKLVGQRAGAARCDRAREAGVGEGHLPEEDLDLDDDGSRHPHRSGELRDRAGGGRERHVLATRSRRPSRSSELKEKFSRATSVYRRRLPRPRRRVGEQAAPRASAAKGDGAYEYRVAKNTVAAARGRTAPTTRAIAAHFVGPTAVAISFGDPAGLAKILDRVRRRDNEKLAAAAAASLDGAACDRRVASASRRCRRSTRCAARSSACSLAPATQLARAGSVGGAARGSVERAGRAQRGARRSTRRQASIAG